MQPPLATFSSPRLQRLLTRNGHVVLDGALATLLESQGHDLNDPLWSARILLSDPDAIYSLHRLYFLAGADVAITASYQATELGLAACGVGADDARALFVKSVELAAKAREGVQNDQPGREMVIAGSVGPFGAYLANGAEYTGDYYVGAEEMKNFHRSRIDALVSAGVDVLACETMPSFPEVQALLSLLREYPATPAWFSFTLKDEAYISDGTGLEKVCSLLNESPQVVAVGINCVDYRLVTPALKNLQTLTPKLLIAYPNSGETYDGSNNTWSGPRHDGVDLGRLALEWKHAGASILGGCCRTTPADISSIRKHLDDNVG